MLSTSRKTGRKALLLYWPLTSDPVKGPAPLLASNIWPCDLWITQSFSLIGPTVWNSFLLDLWSTKSFPLTGPTVWNSFLLDLLSTKSFSLIGPSLKQLFAWPLIHKVHYCIEFSQALEIFTFKSYLLSHQAPRAWFTAASSCTVRIVVSGKVQFIILSYLCPCDCWQLSLQSFFQGKSVWQTVFIIYDYAFPKGNNKNNLTFLGFFLVPESEREQEHKSRDSGVCVCVCVCVCVEEGGHFGESHRMFM